MRVPRMRFNNNNENAQAWLEIGEILSSTVSQGQNLTPKVINAVLEPIDGLIELVQLYTMKREIRLLEIEQLERRVSVQLFEK